MEAKEAKRAKEAKSSFKKRLEPGYKRTEVGVIPEDWEVVSVGSIASFTSGNSISVAALHQQSSSAPIPVYGGNGIAGYTTSPLVQEPVVVVGRVGQKCGEVYLTRGPAWITDNALYPRAIFRQLDVRFLALALKAAGLNDLRNRNDLPLITQSILHSVRIPLPPNKAEQEAIVEVLGKADALIECFGRLLAKKRLLKRGVMQKLLTGKRRLPGFSGEWETRRLGDIATFFSGGTPSTAVADYYAGDIPWITSGDLNQSYIRDVRGRISKSGLENSAAKMVEANTLLIALYGATAGVTAISEIRAAINQAVLAIVPRFDDTRFLYFKLSYLKDWLITTYTQGGQPNLSGEIVKSVELSMPSLGEQVTIAALLSAMDAEIALLEAQLGKYRQIKQGLMQNLLTGRIRLV